MSLFWHHSLLYTAMKFFCGLVLRDLESFFKKMKRKAEEDDGVGEDILAMLKGNTNGIVGSASANNLRRKKIL